MDKVLLKIEDIELRTFSLSEENELYKLIDKNRDHIGEWLIWVDKTNSVEDVEKIMQEWLESREKGERIHFGIWYQAKLVGVIAFTSIDKDLKKGSIGYWLDSAYQGKGIVTKSCERLIDYGFKELNLHQVEISCATANSKSKAIPQRLGFTKKGTFKKSEQIRGGKLVDNELYGLLKQDWKK